MRSPKLRGVLLASLFVVSGPLAFAQSAKPTADPAPQKAATEEEVQQLRREVADLKAQIQQLVWPALSLRHKALTSSKPTLSSIPHRRIPLLRPLPLRQTTSTTSKKRSTCSRRSPTTPPQSPQGGTASTFS